MTGTVWDSVGAIPDEESLRRAIRQRVEAAGTSFYWAMRLLPRNRCWHHHVAVAQPEVPYLQATVRRSGVHMRDGIVKDHHARPAC